MRGRGRGEGEAGGEGGGALAGTRERKQETGADMTEGGGRRVLNAARNRWAVW